ncbi:M56 family metallopeptidase, partial [Candidatus Poribacteria bacterium]
MSVVILAINSAGKNIFLALMNTSLQMALLILLVWSMIRVFRLRSATTRYYLWFLAVFGIVALPVFGVLLPVISIPVTRNQEAVISSTYISDIVADENIVSPLNMETDTAETPAEAPAEVAKKGQWQKRWTNVLSSLTRLDLVSAISLLWFTAVLFMLGRLIRSHIWLRHFVRKARGVTDGQILEIVSRLRERMDIKGNIGVFISSVNVNLKMDYYGAGNSRE